MIGFCDSRKLYIDYITSKQADKLVQYKCIMMKIYLKLRYVDTRYYLITTTFHTHITLIQKY